MHGLLIAAGAVAQLAHGLGGIEAVVPGQVVHGERGHQRLGPLALGLFFHHFAHQACHAQGQEHAHGPGARLLGDHPGEVPEAHLAVSQDVALAAAAALNGANGAVGEVAHVTQVEAAVDARGHFTVDDLDHRAGGFSHSEVLRAHDAAGMHHAGVQAASVHRVQHRLSGQRLGLAVAVAQHAVVEVMIFRKSEMNQR